MGFRKTPEEIELIRAAFTDPVYVHTKTLAITFETRPEDIAAILPPPLEPAGRPYAACGIGEFTSSVGFWKGGGLFIPARYGDMSGQYVVAMYGDLDSPCFYGRQQFGEPKKLAQITFERDGNQMHASLTRHGVRVIEMHANLTGEGPVPEEVRPGSGINFNFKFVIKPDASGFEWGPVLTRNGGGLGKAFVSKTGTGSLEFGVSPHDPLADLQIVRVRGASYSESSSYGGGTVENVAQVDADAFYPYALNIFDALDVFHKQSLAQTPKEELEAADKLRTRPMGGVGVRA